jgi:hypothetical protein
LIGIGSPIRQSLTILPNEPNVVEALAGNPNSENEHFEKCDARGPQIGIKLDLENYVCSIPELQLRTKVSGNSLLTLRVRIPNHPEDVDGVSLDTAGICQKSLPNPKARHGC